MTRSLKTLCLFAFVGAISTLYPSAPASAALLWSDNFDIGGSADLNASMPAGPSRLSGSAATETELEAFGALQPITNDQLGSPGNGGVRFGPETARYDWAGATTGADILSAGGFQVTFDWTNDGTDTEWVAWKVGTNNSDTPVNGASVDHALLLRNGPNGVGETNERWDNGTNLGFSGVSHNPVVGTQTTYPVSLTYSFGSFADGTNVNLVAKVGGISVVNDNFIWDGNAGALHMEMHANTSAHLVDNLAISTIPEPSTVLLSVAGCIAIALVRRSV